MLHMRRSRRRAPVTRQEIALIAVTAFWGTTFLVVHTALAHSGPWFFVGVRFLSAALAALIAFRRSLRAITRREVLAGALIGLMLYAGYGLQTVGLQTITPSASAFITALYVPLVPMILWAVNHRRPRTMTLVGVGVAFAGLVLLADPFSLNVGFGTGEIVTIASTIGIAGEIILIGHFAGTVRLGTVTVIQLAVVGLLALATMPVAAEPVPTFSWAWLLPGVGLGAASAVIQLTMNWAQRTVDPTKAALIYAGEPVWGGLFGRLAGDRLPPIAILGAVLIVAGVILSELKPGTRPAQTTGDDPLPPGHEAG